MSSIFLIGASGFVGGQVLRDITRAHPELSIAALVRDSKTAERISSSYPKVRVVLGGLDDAELVSSEASKASIVLNAGSNKHIPGAKAIQSGLAKRNSLSYWVQISGASALAIKSLSSPDYDVGLPDSTVYDDLDGIADIRALLRDHPVREMDNLVLDVNKTNPLIKTAILFPPIIYGKGDGPIHQRSIQIPSLAKVTLEKGHVVRAGAGLNRWGSIHVSDISKVFVGLALEAAKGNQDDALWGDNGLYLTSTGEHSFADISDSVSRAARDQGLIKSDEVEVLSKSESDKVLPGGSVFFGSNARGNARRAAALFGWTPTGPTLEEEIPRAVAEEAASRA